MPPVRKKPTKKSSRLVHLTSESQDDDVFEPEQPKKVFRRYKARQIPLTNSKANSTSKHVVKKQNSSPKMADKTPMAVASDSDEDCDDIELDLEQPNKSKRKWSPDLARDDSTASPNAKRVREYLNDDSDDEVPESISDKDTPTKDSNESNERATDFKPMDDDILPNDSNPPNSPEAEKDDQSDGELIECELDKQTEIEHDADIEHDSGKLADDNECDSQDEVVVDEEVTIDVGVDDEAECSPNLSNEPNVASDEDNEDDDELSQGNADDDILDLDIATDNIFDDDILKSPRYSPVFASKKPTSNIMSMPNWKKAEIEKGKTSETIQIQQNVDADPPEQRKLIGLSNNNIEPVEIETIGARNQTVDSEKVIFKVPKPLMGTLVRDPRLTRTVTQDNNIIRVIQNDVKVTGTLRAQPIRKGARSTILIDGPRIPAKERLGVRRDNQNSNSATVVRPTVFPNKPKPAYTSASASNDPLPPLDFDPTFLANRINNPTSSLVDPRKPPSEGESNVAQQKAPTQNEPPPVPTSASNPLPSMAFDPTFLANRIKQPTSLRVDPRKPPSKAESNIAQQTAIPQNEPPQMPAFALNPVQKKVVLLTMPSFASGAQQYEPVFTYLFKRTCRYFMTDTCQNPNECQLEHRLPDHDFFCTSLDKMYQKSVIDLYDNYMRRNDKLFNFYIEDFCKYFGRNNLTENLKQMVEDCNERHGQFHFPTIVEGFRMTGKSFTQALGVLISSVQCRSGKTSEAIMKLILNKENENIRPFVGTLNSLARDQKFKIKVEWMNRLLLICNEKNVTELNDTIWYVIQDSNDMLAKLDPEHVTKFMDAYGRSKKV